MPKKNKLPLVQAIAWIVGSLIAVSGSTYSGYQAYNRYLIHRDQDPEGWISAIVQTGPQKEALKIDYLAELMQISGDHPVQLKSFDCALAEKKLLSSLVIKQASVKPLLPSTLYVDYAVRTPLAWLYEYENIAIDEEGHFFPVYPFFTPKNLPEICLGLSEGEEPIHDERLELALSLLNLVQQAGIPLKRIDVTHACAESYGMREIVVVCEEKVGELTHKHILRLSTKNYAQELGNYLSLREELLKKGNSFASRARVIDLRLSKIGFITQ